MKKSVLTILLFIMLTPFFVNAQTCDTGKISITSISIENKSDNVKELEEAKISGKNISLNLSMREVGDNIKYKFLIKNESPEDYKLDKTSLNLNSDYINYSFETADNSNIVKANSSKSVILKVEYKTDVPEEKFISGSYNENKSMNVQLSNETINNKADTLNNPNTEVQAYIIKILIILIISGSIYLLLKKKSYVKYMILIISTAILIPISVYAICKYQIEIDSIVKITKNYNPCTFDGEITQGVEYINGQYTYRYKQELKEFPHPYEEYNILRWDNIDENGWGVSLTDYADTNNIDTKLCSSINGIPIVSMNYMLSGSKSNYVDLSSFDTSNVLRMKSMFSSSKFETLDLSSFDTKNVTDMSYMFHNSQATELNLRSFNTSKVENMAAMFNWSFAKKLDLSNFNTSNVVNMNGMFMASQATDLNISSFNTSSVTDMGSMFAGSKSSKLLLTNFDTSKVTKMYSMFSDSEATSIDVSSFETSKVTSLRNMFNNSKAEIINLDNFNTSNVTDMYGLFSNSNATAISLKNFNTSKVTNMRSMFAFTKVEELDLSSFDMSNVTIMQGMLVGTTARLGYARTEQDATYLNTTAELWKPNSLIFVVK